MPILGNMPEEEKKRTNAVKDFSPSVTLFACQPLCQRGASALLYELFAVHCDGNIQGDLHHLGEGGLAFLGSGFHTL